jgi:SAM-dependent methyltransferase
MTDLYRRPDEYDLEHVGDEEDVIFYVGLARGLKPKSVPELACGTGGLDCEANMLKLARDKAAHVPVTARKRLKLVLGDMRKWHGREPFDLIVVPCASITHLLDLRDQLDVWRRAFQNLAPGGRFVVETVMPNFSAYADSFGNPPRTLVEIDRDVTDKPRQRSLVRRRTVTYLPYEQRAQIRFLYEKYHRKVLLSATSTTLKATCTFRANCGCCSFTPASRSRFFWGLQSAAAASQFPAHEHDREEAGWQLSARGERMGTSSARISFSELWRRSAGPRRGQSRLPASGS